MRRSSVFASVSAGALSLTGCVAPSQPAPRPAPPVAAPRPAPVPTPTPTPPPPPASADWRDWPLTPGTWSYRADTQGSIASFGLSGAPAELTLRCDRARSRIVLTRTGLVSAAALIVRTTSIARTLPVSPVTTGAAADLAARDMLIDAMGYSRGRFVVQGGGAPTLVVPAWAEILRVAEDCRG
ncbi:hypothetical protein [Sphingomonas sp. Root241]|uniref:hypothetical protein n=1 Tax=Sphingomonas sp. Root241 TaxID=1736501 RepID=UPI0006FBD65E|nr:hypothetical protein [Sphingomonas sp. Root241]KRC81150.1 hypothetical protein ASE13_01660 [Sphingomonas sp. Root241]